MSGICSRHKHHEQGCRLCETDIREVLPDYDRKLAEARAAGEVTCGVCGFRFLRTTDTCPACSGWTWVDGGHRVRGRVGDTDMPTERRLVAEFSDATLVAMWQAYALAHFKLKDSKPTDGERADMAAALQAALDQGGVVLASESQA